MVRDALGCPYGPAFASVRKAIQLAGFAMEVQFQVYCNGALHPLVSMALMM